MVVNLNGNSYNNPLSLSGKPHYLFKSVNSEIDRFKKKVITNYMIPLYAKQWQILNENFFFINKMINDANRLNKYFKTEDLSVYINLLTIIKLFIDEHNLLIYDENKNKAQSADNQFSSMMVRIPKIRLLPEYEIYNSILGIPDRSNNCSYDKNIIKNIKLLLEKPDISYKKIKDYISSIK